MRDPLAIKEKNPIRRAIERYASRINRHQRACWCQQCALIRRNAARYARKRGLLAVYPW